MTKKCVICGKKITGKKNKKFCSRECYLINEKNKSGKKCKYCGKSFCCEGNVRKSYCSKECYLSDIRVKKETRKCLNCGKSFDVRKTIGKKFCSRSCNTKYQLRDKEEMIKRVKARKNTIKKKYGVNDSSNIPGSRKKWEKTMEKRYGSTSYNNKEKRKATLGIKKLKQIINTGLWEPLFDIDGYSGSNTEHPFRCNTCNNVFSSNMTKIYPRCPVCYPKIKYGVSTYENELCDFITKMLNKTPVIKNDRSVLPNNKELDIYIPSLKLAIEFDGLYWHSESEGKYRNYHLEKTNECKNRGIRLIHVFEDEWTYKKDIVKSRLTLAIKDPQKDLKRVHARKCTIKEITPNLKNEFLNENHIQGAGSSSVKLGAFYEDDLMAVMTFSKPKISMGHKNIKPNVYDLNKFCMKKNTVSSGMAAKMLKFFINKYNPKSIITYSDNRWNIGSLYINLGFKMVSGGSPNYWYIKDGTRLHRYNFRKDTLKKKLKIFNNDLTEYENMKLNGYERIWDCGSNKYELICVDKVL